MGASPRIRNYRVQRVKEEQIVAKRDNETGKEKAKRRKHVKEQMVAKRANKTAEEKAKRTKDDKGLQGPMKLQII